MTDWHSHVLPFMDDGAASVAESVELLSTLSSQGVSRVCATPHFDAEFDTPEKFFKKREESYKILLSAPVDKPLPEILLGAEVRYFPGISNMKELYDFRILGTDLLLVEMPTEKWSEYTFSELIRLSRLGQMRLILAHAERCRDFYRASVRKRLLASGILIQSNASFFIDKASRRTAIKLLKNEEIHCIGSDCHNLKTRPPRIDCAADIIRKKLGEHKILN